MTKELDIKEVKKNIDNMFDTYKSVSKITCDISIDDNERDNEMEIIFTDEGVCGTVIFDLNTNILKIDNVEYCGTSITKILKFIKIIKDIYDSTYSYSDASVFRFVNETTNETLEIRLKQLYTLCYGATFYSKTLYDSVFLENVSDAYIPKLNISILDNIPSLQDNEVTTISTIKQKNVKINTIGDFFIFLKEDMKNLTKTSLREQKIIDNSNWETIISYSKIINNVYDFLEKKTIHFASTSFSQNSFSPTLRFGENVKLPSHVTTKETFPIIRFDEPQTQTASKRRKLSPQTQTASKRQKLSPQTQTASKRQKLSPQTQTASKRQQKKYQTRSNSKRRQKK